MSICLLNDFLRFSLSLFLLCLWSIFVMYPLFPITHGGSIVLVKPQWTQHGQVQSGKRSFHVSSSLTAEIFNHQYANYFLMLLSKHYSSIPVGMFLHLTDFVPLCMCAVAQSCPNLCNPMDCSLPGSSVHGISQAIILQWVAMPSSRGSSLPRDQNLACLLHFRWILY